MAREADLDAVTALSGSGPAYVFFFLEAMIEAGTEMGLPAEQARRLAQETFAGAAQLAMQSDDSLALLRERVTSKGGTTHAAISSLQADGVKAAFVKALRAAQQRARELGDKFERNARSSTTPANTAKPTQWFSLKAMKQPSRVRVRISV